MFTSEHSNPQREAPVFLVLSIARSHFTWSNLTQGKLVQYRFGSGTRNSTISLEDGTASDHVAILSLSLPETDTDRVLFRMH